MVYTIVLETIGFGLAGSTPVNGTIKVGRTLVRCAVLKTVGGKTSSGSIPLPTAREDCQSGLMERIANP